MIYVTGDLHGHLERFQSKAMHRLKKNDTLLVCGDFGFFWDSSREERRLLNWLSKRRYRILFVEGAHENYSILDRVPYEEFCGGQARHMEKNIWQLRRGDVFTIEGKTVFAFGGGDDETLDLAERDDCPTFSRLPDEGEIRQALENLSAHGNQVDIIVSHDIGYRVKDFLQMKSLCFNNLHAFLDEVSHSCRFGKWYFGCYHLDKFIPPNYYAVYREVLPVESK